jgi:hypothetical protein
MAILRGNKAAGRRWALHCEGGAEVFSRVCFNDPPLGGLGKCAA